MNQNMTIIRKHVRSHVSVDSCQIHGIGIGMCRIHKMERYMPRHRADMPTLSGFDVRMGL